MQPPNPSVFVDEIFGYQPAMEIDSPPGQTLQLPGAPPFFNPVPDPTGHLEVSHSDWGVVQPSPFARVLAPAEIDPGNFNATLPMYAESTKVTDSSFDLNTFLDTMDQTNFSSFDSIMVDAPAAGNMDQPMDFKLSPNSFFMQMSLDSHFEVSAQCDAEGRKYGDIFASASPWDSQSSYSKPWAPLVKAGSVHKRVQEFEELSRTGELKSDLSLNMGSALPQTSNNPSNKAKEYEEKIQNPSGTFESEFCFNEISRTDYYNTARHPVLDGNNSDDEDYNNASNLSLDSRYETFANEINAAQDQGTLMQSSPRKPSTDLLMASDSSRNSSNSYARIMNRSDSIPGIEWEESYEDHSWDVPQINFDEEPKAAEITDAAIEDCVAQLFERGQDLHPSGSQPPCDSRESTLSQPGPRDREVSSESDDSLSSLFKASPPASEHSFDGSNSPSASSASVADILDAADDSPLPAQSKSKKAKKRTRTPCSKYYTYLSPIPEEAEESDPEDGYNGQPTSRLGNSGPRENHQQLDNTTANHSQHKASTDRSAIPSTIGCGSGANMAAHSIQPQIHSLPGNILLESCSGASFLETLQQAPAAIRPISEDQSLTLQIPTMATPASFEVMETLPDELFSGPPRATMSRVSSLNVPTDGIPSLGNLISKSPSQLDFIPRSYFTDPDFLGLSEDNAAASNPLQQIGQPILEEFLNETALQEFKQFANKPQLEIEPKAREQSQQSPQQKTPVAPVAARATARPTKTCSVFMRSDRMKRASRAKQRHLDKFRVSKSKTREDTGIETKPKKALSAQMSNLIRDKLDQAIQQQQISTTPVQEQPTSTTPVQEEKPETTKGKKERKGKAAFNYDGVKVPHQVLKLPRLQNLACSKTKENQKYKSQLICLNKSGNCSIERTRYQRNTLAAVEKLHHDVVYEKNESFGAARPYQQEFTRTELDPKTKRPMIETRSALCAYCEEINFFELKNSCYSQHMSHTHGIYTDNYLAPNPLLNGKYKVSKKPSQKRKTQPRIRSRDGVVCPACYEVVEIRCWTSTSEKKPLSNYLRHFKEHHRVDKRKETFFNSST